MSEARSRTRTKLLMAITLTSVLVGLVDRAAAEKVEQNHRSHDQDPYGVDMAESEWRDPDRQRVLPYRVYFPVEAEGEKWPVILFSHGLGGTRDAAEYLGRFLASRGFACFHLQHRGTDDSIWADGISLRTARLALQDWRSALHRFRDVPFAIESISRLAAEPGPFFDRLDLDRIGMSGHSYGAVSTLVAAGQRLGSELSFREPRIRAGIAFSPAPPQREPDPAESWSDVAIPLLHFTGTEDRSEVRELGPSDRRIPFERISGIDQVLVTLAGGDHMVFSGRPRRGTHPRDPRFREIIETVSLNFWNAYLRDDGFAKEWLFGDGIRSAVGDDAVVEWKRNADAPSRGIHEGDQRVSSVSSISENAEDHL